MLTLAWLTVFVFAIDDWPAAPSPPSLPSAPWIWGNPDLNAGIQRNGGAAAAGAAVAISLTALGASIAVALVQPPRTRSSVALAVSSHVYAVVGVGAAAIGAYLRCAPVCAGSALAATVSRTSSCPTCCADVKLPRSNSLACDRSRVSLSALPSLPHASPFLDSRPCAARVPHWPRHMQLPSSLRALSLPGPSVCLLARAQVCAATSANVCSPTPRDPAPPQSPSSRRHPTTTSPPSPLRWGYRRRVRTSWRPHTRSSAAPRSPSASRSRSTLSPSRVQSACSSRSGPPACAGAGCARRRPTRSRLRRCAGDLDEERMPV